jgi:acyl dehydratase
MIRSPSISTTRRRGPRSSANLVASGWHTAAVAMRMMVEHFFGAAGSMGSPGMEELRWPRPVRVGDRLRLRVTVEQARRSQSKPDRGLVHFLTEVLNQEGEVVMRLRGMAFFRVRP